MILTIDKKWFSNNLNYEINPQCHGDCVDEYGNEYEFNYCRTTKSYLLIYTENSYEIIYGYFEGFWRDDSDNLYTEFTPRLVQD